MALDRYTSIGSYPLYYWMDPAAILCPSCADEKLATPEDERIEPVIALVATINWESEMYCDDCGEQIESAYGVAK